MSYQQPPDGTPPSAGGPAAAPIPGAPAPGAGPAAAPVLRKDPKTLVAALLGLVAVALLLVAVLGHTWFRPENLPDEVSGGAGLWSMSMEGMGRSVEEPLTRLVDAASDDEAQVKAGLFAYGSMVFFVLNWLLIAVLFVGMLVGFQRFGSGRPAGVPFALTLIPTIVAAVAFLVWFGVSVLLSEVLDGMDVGGMVFVWWVAIAAAFVAAILYAKTRSQAAFGAGFRGTGGMMPPGGGIVGGPQMLPPGSGTIGNPADGLGGPR
ncbi:MAG: hypothetical protein GYA57_18645 [Myxococcales bacterium]|nr:hypothetical protein [Myxococcales bacterium]